MYSPPPSPTPHADTDWKSKYYEVSDLLTETRAELDEFTRTSKELEEELEKDLERTERAQDELRMRVSKVENERDEWKSKFMALQHTHNTTTNSLQRELDAVRQSVQLYKAQVRDLEMGNDDLERNERQAASSLADVEQKYAKALEDKILLEHELQDKAAVEEICQRLRDELRDANLEITVLKEQAEQLRQLPIRPVVVERHTSSSSSLPLVSPTGSDHDSLMRTPAPDLTVDDLLPSTPRESLSRATSSRFSLPSRLSQEFSDGQELSEESPTSSVVSRKALTRTAFSATPTQTTFLQRTLSPTSSNASTTSTRLPTPRHRPMQPPPSPQPSPPVQPPRIPVFKSALPKSRGVQMVSEMRARVKNLEQRIHSGMPKLRVASGSSAISALPAARARPPSRTSGVSTTGSVRTPKKTVPAITKEPASPWVMIADEGDGDTTLQHSPERVPRLPPVPTMSPFIPPPLEPGQSGIRPPSRTTGLRSTSTNHRNIFGQSTPTTSRARNRSPVPPPPNFGLSRDHAPRATSASAAATTFRAAASTNTVTAPTSPASEGRPTTPTHKSGTSTTAIRRAHTVSSPSKPPTIAVRPRRELTFQPKTSSANTANAGVTPGRPKSRSVTNPSPTPPVPSLPAVAHATSKNVVLGQSKIATPTGLTKGRMARLGLPLAESRIGRAPLESDMLEEEDEFGVRNPLTTRNRSGTLG